MVMRCELCRLISLLTSSLFLLRPNAALDYHTYIPILLQGAALVAVRHCRVTNFPSWVRTATRAAPCKWPIGHTKDRRTLRVQAS